MKKNIAIILFFVIAVIIALAYLPESINEQGGNLFFNKLENDRVVDKGPIRGGSISLFSTTPDTLNPIFTRNKYVKDFSKLIYEGLVTINGDQMVAPNIAKDWEISEDGLTWTFYLREDISWHDGQMLSSEDVVFTMDVILNSGIENIYKYNLTNVDTFYAISENEFKLKLNQPDSFTPWILTFPIIPKHYHWDEELLINNNNFNPIGTGPYKVLSVDLDSEINLTINDKWKPNEIETNDNPYIENIDIKLFDNSSYKIKAFSNGIVDIIDVDSSRREEFAARRNVNTSRYTTNEFEFISLNMNNIWLSDSNFRRALLYGINNIEIANKVIQGGAVPSDMPIKPDTFFNDRDAVMIAPNQGRAIEILRENDFNLQGDRLHKQIYGTTRQVNLEILVNEDNELRIKIAEEIKHQLERMGIRAQVTKLSWDNMMSRINGQRYDMAILGVSVATVPDISFLYHSRNIGGLNMGRYHNPQVDKYLDSMKIEKDYLRVRTTISNIKSIVNRESPYIGLFFHNRAIVYNNKIKGTVVPHRWNIYNDITQWYVLD